MPTWADGSALAFHFETQPLPTALAWYVHHLPPTILEWAVWMTFVIELALPICIFLPRNIRLVAAGGFVLLEALIFATGNYNFFNILTIVLCIALLDDRWTKPIVRGVSDDIGTQSIQERLLPASWRSASSSPSTPCSGCRRR